MTNIISGKLIVNDFGNGFVNIDKNIIIYINKKNLNGAFNGEIVDVEYYKNNELYYGTVVNYSLLNKIFIGKVDHFFYDNVYIYCNELGKSNLITVKTQLYLKKNDWIKVEIVDHNNNLLTGKILEILPNDIDFIIENKYKLNYILDKNIQNYNENDDFKDINLKNYVNQTYLDTFTIDPLNCMDCDDAFSIIKDGDKYNIFVHISDVSYYINPDKEIFHDIMLRGNTFYGKNKNWSMIPQIYANNICSILPNKRTRVVTNHFVYDPSENDVDKKLVYVKWFYSYIISKNKYDYDYVDNILNSNKNENFNTIYQSSQIIKNIINDIDLTFDTKAHSMIKYWMIYVNQIMCNEIKKIYRYNPLPSDDKFELLLKYSNNNSLKSDRNELIDFIKSNSNKLTFYLTKNLLTKAFYSTYIENESHYGIGINNYTHWTSPIRRSCDLLNHCILRGYNINKENMEIYIKYMNDMEIIQDDIENFINQFDMYQNIKLNDIFEGTIIGINKIGINIFIDNLDDKFSIHISKLSNQILQYDNINKTLKNIDGNILYKLFDKIKVKVIKIDTNKIDFALA